MRNPQQVAVVGVTGYTGFELARHAPASSRKSLSRFSTFAKRNGAKCLAELFPQLRGLGEAPLRQLSIDAIRQSGAGTAFLATPHEVSAEIAPALVEAGIARR